MSELIARPMSAGVEEAYALAQRWLPAFLAGRKADDDVYAPDVATWHNTSETVSTIQQTPSRTRANAAGADLRVRIPIRGRAESLNIVTAASNKKAGT